MALTAVLDTLVQLDSEDQLAGRLIITLVVPL
jgi:hypothetical protein